MTSVKVPVLISKYSEGIYTARVVDGPEADVAGETASQSFETLRRYLRNQGNRTPDQYWPRIQTYELQQTSVRVRLFYRDGNRQFPASREMKIPVRYVLGRYVDNSVECFLPDYDIVFHCPAIRDLTQLIEEAVRGAAAHGDSRALAAATPPMECELRLIRLRLSESQSKLQVDLTPTLSAVANPVFQQQRKRKAIPRKHRDEEVGKLLTVMGEASVLLVGPSGCGKSTVVQLAGMRSQNAAKLAAKTKGQESPPPLTWESSAEHLIAGRQYLGEWEQRLERVIAELEAIGGVLVIPSLIDLVRLGGSQPTDSLAAFLMPYVRRGELRIIAEATADELDATRRLLPGWAECFQVLKVDPLSHDQTRDIAHSMLTDAARNCRLDVDETAAETTTRLFAQFMPYHSPPRGVVQLISDTVESALCSSRGSLVAPAGTPPRQAITSAMVVDQFTRRTGLPEAMLRDSLTLHRDQLRTRLGRDVMGQDGAVDSVCSVVLRLKAGLCDPRRPVATMLFCGPTGVGKTQLARSLADYLFGAAESSEKPFVRLDMSEFTGWEAADRFLVGSDGEVAPWIAKLRARPMSVVLFDEFEKSSPEVHDCLLACLDEGRLTDRFGRTTTLCGAIVILTSNVGSRSTAPIGFGSDDHRAIRRAVEHEFRPEFLNRIDEVLVFDPLPPAVIRKIVEKELESLNHREAIQSRQIKIRWNDAVVDHLASVGFDPLLGARPLQRAIEGEVVARIARRLLEEDSDASTKDIDLAELLQSGE